MGGLPESAHEGAAGDNPPLKIIITLDPRRVYEHVTLHTLQTALFREEQLNVSGELLTIR